MKTETITNILSEDFEMPVCTCDLMDLIESNLELYYDKPLNRKETSQFKRKLNELISEYNERRNMKIYNYLK